VALEKQRSRLYVKARNINEGMHRFQKYTKLLAFVFFGIALWVNDLGDSWVSWLCQNADNVTQSTLCRFLFGRTTELSPIYQTYNLVMTLVTIPLTALISRWFFWTSLMIRLEESNPSYGAGDFCKEITLLCGLWFIEYGCVGILASMFFGLMCPFLIPVWPSLTTLFLVAVAWSTVVTLEGLQLPLISQSIKPRSGTDVWEDCYNRLVEHVTGKTTIRSGTHADEPGR
jgi:hypothetical protein